MSSYQYEALDPTTLEIRLLTLERGSSEAEISCRLHHASLGSGLTYEALSYTWGDANNLREILLGNQRFKVTANLEIALRHLRREDDARTLWVDALCINQADLGERGAQVLRMREIFSTATTVLAWTGEASEDSDEAMTVAEEVAALTENSEDDLPTVGVGPAVLRQMGLEASTMNRTALWRF